VADCNGPIPRASAYIPGRSSFALTDNLGEFLLADLPEGLYMVEIQAGGTPGRFRDVPVTAGAQTELDAGTCPE